VGHLNVTPTGLFDTHSSSGVVSSGIFNNNPGIQSTGFPENCSTHQNFFQFFTIGSILRIDFVLAVFLALRTIVSELSVAVGRSGRV
jgi:hypothetical protein